MIRVPTNISPSAIRDVLLSENGDRLAETFFWGDAPQGFTYWRDMCSHSDFGGQKLLSYSAKAYLRWVLFCVENNYQPEETN